MKPIIVGYDPGTTAAIAILDTKGRILLLKNKRGFKKSKKSGFCSMDRRTQKKKVLIDVIIFLIKFNLLLVPFYAIIYFDVSSHPLQTAFANFIAFILKSMNYQVKTSGFYLFIGKDEYPIDISMDCIGWKSVYSLFALVFATGGKTREKLKFLAIWMPVLFIINILRVLITLLVGLNFGMQHIEFVHTFLWQEVMIASIIIIWYFWLKKRKLNREKREN